ncbi:CG32767 [Drosophila busckii]|uniref:CG32767 n=1 Tax=Drosophila busckii TaxID=30019 RepID=A0A0M5J7V2_DROBS|nr:CG32767 [Drosophila busckii]
MATQQQLLQTQVKLELEDEEDEDVRMQQQQQQQQQQLETLQQQLEYSTAATQQLVLPAGSLVNSSLGVPVPEEALAQLERRPVYISNATMGTLSGTTAGHTNNMKCAICNMVLKSLKNYEKHCLRCKPYECQICGRVVRFRPNFIKHMRVHTGQQSERHKYKCEVCHKEFMSFEYFKVHKKIHNENVNLTCEICGKVFSALASLRGHSKLHSGVKLHKCDVCGKGFGQRYNLKIHARTHTGDFPFECKTHNHFDDDDDDEKSSPSLATAAIIKVEPNLYSSGSGDNSNDMFIKEEVMFEDSAAPNSPQSPPSSKFRMSNFDGDLVDHHVDLNHSLPPYGNLFEPHSIPDSIPVQLYPDDDDDFRLDHSSLGGLHNTSSSTTDGDFIKKEWVYGSGTSSYAMNGKFDDDSDALCDAANFIYN